MGRFLKDLAYVLGTNQAERSIKCSFLSGSGGQGVDWRNTGIHPFYAATPLCHAPTLGQSLDSC